MEYLQNEVFELNNAISTTLLSLVQRISISESEKLLNEFWDKHRTDLDAAFKWVSIEKNKTKIKILNHKELDSSMKDAKIYLVSKAAASDEAVLAQVAGKCRDLQLTLKLEDLSPTGYGSNPLLNQSFSVRSQSVFGPVSGAQPSHTKASTPAVDSKSVAKLEAKRESDIESKAPVAKKVKQEPPSKPQKGLSDKAAGEKGSSSSSSTSKSPSPATSTGPAAKKDNKPKQSAFPFQKIDKATALKSSTFSRKPLHKPVTERVVAATDVGDENSDDNEDLSEDPSREQDQKSSRENEMKNLESLFQTNAHMELDETVVKDDETTVEGARQNADNQMSENVNNDSKPPTNSESLVEDPVEPARSPAGNDGNADGDQPAPESEAPSGAPVPNTAKDIIIDPKTGRKMRYIKKTVTVPLKEDEEGFAVMGTKMVDMLVEVDDSGEPLDQASKDTFEKSANTSSPSAREVKDKKPPSKPARSQAKAANPKQGSLLSFFNMKKK